MNATKELQQHLDDVFGRRPQVAVAIVEERRKARAAMARARRLAAKHGIDIERERDGYWVTHPDFDDGADDPCQGEHFAVGGCEVLTAVEAYVFALRARQLAAQHSLRELQSMLASELEARERLIAHQRRIQPDALGIATLRAHDEEIAVMRDAIALVAV